MNGDECRVVITGLLGKWPVKDMTVDYCSQLAGKSGNSGVSTTTKMGLSENRVYSQ